MAKQVQIDWDLFCDIYNYFFDGTAPALDDFAAQDIRNRLNAKVDKIISRELFSKYKRAVSGTEREAARQEYLNHRGVFSGYRTDEEVPNL